MAEKPKEGKKHNPKEELKSLAKELEERLIKRFAEEPKIEEELEEKPKPKKSTKIKKDDVLEIKSDKKETLVPLEDYVKCAVHLGTKVITPSMRKFIYRRRADGLAVINTNIIDEKLREAIAFMVNYEPHDIFLACKREAGWDGARKFAETTGIKTFTKKYPAGVITNLKLADFFETELIMICDPWMDKNALKDAVITKKPVIAVCDANNNTPNVTKVIPANNKAGKSIGLILYILAREYCKAKKMPFNAVLEDFTGKLDEVEA